MLMQGFQKIRLFTSQILSCVTILSLILQFYLKGKQTVVFTSQSGPVHNEHSQACTIGLFDSQPVRHATVGDFIMGTTKHVILGNEAVSQCSM